MTDQTSPVLRPAPEAKSLAARARSATDPTTDVAAANPAVVSQLLAFAEKCRADLGDSLTKRTGAGAREPGRIASANATGKKKQKE